MKTIKIIDLFNKIANGEEVPKKIKYLNAIYIYSKETKQYYKFDGFEDTILTKSLRAVLINFGRLNDEVLIIEEKKKLPKKIQTIGSKWYSDYIESYIDEEDKYSCYDELLMNKINDLIDYLESKEKGE